MISVVMAVYNGEAFLEDQIKSILTQTEQNIELIITDDRSSDLTPDIVRRWSRKDSRIRFFENPERLGPSLNFLQGLSFSRGDRLAFSDQDDVWAPDKLGRLKQALESDPGAHLIYSDLEVCDKELFPQGSFFKVSGMKPEIGRVAERSLLRNVAPGCSMFFDAKVREMFLKIKDNWAEVFLHDHLTFVIAAGLGRIRYFPEKLVFYRQHEKNMIGSSASKAKFFKKNYFNDLQKRINCLRILREDLSLFDWDRLGRFTAQGLFDPEKPAIGFLDYQLFMRRANLKDRFLGVFQSMFPRFYELAQNFERKSR